MRPKFLPPAPLLRLVVIATILIGTLVVVVVLTATSDDRQPDEVANELCAGHEGVEQIARESTTVLVVCKDGWTELGSTK